MTNNWPLLRNNYEVILQHPSSMIVRWSYYFHLGFWLKFYLKWESNPGPFNRESLILPLDQSANSSGNIFFYVNLRLTRTLNIYFLYRLEHLSYLLKHFWISKILFFQDWPFVPFFCSNATYFNRQNVKKRFQAETPLPCRHFKWNDKYGRKLGWFFSANPVEFFSKKRNSISLFT